MLFSISAHAVPLYGKTQEKEIHEKETRTQANIWSGTKQALLCSPRSRKPPITASFLNWMFSRI